MAITIMQALAHGKEEGNEGAIFLAIPLDLLGADFSMNNARSPDRAYCRDLSHAIFA